MSAIHFVSGRGTDASGDLVFVHGLDGDPFTTWNLRGQPGWSSWLVEDRADLNIWTLGYEIRSTAWAGGTLPLSDRAINVLATLDSAGIGSRPLCFITHSMGGLLVKQLLRHAIEFAQEYESIARQTRGVVFLATPHAGSDLASLVSYVRFFMRPTVTITELESHAPALRELNLWYRNRSVSARIASKVFWETNTTRGFTVVNATSADPGIAGVTPIPVEADHIGICKPVSRMDVQYSQVVKFLAERLPKRRAFGPAYFSVQQELIRRHAGRFVGRQPVQEAFSSFLQAHDRGYFLVEGVPGQGKTALASWIAEQHGGPHHFFSRSGGRGDVRLVLASLLAQMQNADRLAFSPADSIGELSKKFEDAVHDLLESVDEPIVIVLDGLDELDHNGGDFLPPFLLTDGLPRHLYFFVTSRPGPLVGAIRDQQYLVPVRTHTLEPLTRDEVRTVVARGNMKLSEQELNSLMEVSSGNALYVDAVAQAEPGVAFDAAALPRRIEGYFRQVLKKAGTNPIVRDVVGFLATARIWLTPRQLSVLMGISERRTADEALALIRPFLVSSGGAYGFYHQAFHAFATQELLGDELRDYHSRIARWLTKPETVDEYRWSSLAYHLASAGDHDGLMTHVTPAFLFEKAQRSGYAVLDDLELLASSLLRVGDPSAVKRSVDLVEALRPTLGGNLDSEVVRSTKRTRSVLRAGGVEICSVLIPRGEVSADFVEVVPRPDRVLLAIGDAPESGLKSAYVARFIATVFRRLVETGSAGPGDILTELNTRIAAHSYFTRVSMLCLSVDTGRGVIGIANAGHPSPVLYSAARRRADRLSIRGRLLKDDMETEPPLPQYEERHAEIGPGDIMVLLSDGVTEDGRLDGQSYGYRFMKILEQHSTAAAASLAELIIDDWRAHPKLPEVSDDVTVVVVKVSEATVTQ
jgi:hypothetical protein